jgi:hypothetical protein
MISTLAIVDIGGLKGHSAGNIEYALWLEI